MTYIKDSSHEIKRAPLPEIVRGQQLAEDHSTLRNYWIVAGLVLLCGATAATVLALIRHHVDLSFASYMLFIVLPLQAVPIGFAVRRFISTSRIVRGLVGGLCALTGSIIGRVLYSSFAITMETSQSYPEVLTLFSQNPDLLISALVIPTHALVTPELMATVNGYQIAADKKPG